jgi:hypothetical protein
VHPLNASVAGTVETRHTYATAYRLLLLAPAGRQSADLEDLPSWPS